MSSIKLDFLGLQKSPSKTAESLDFTGFAAMSSILITHPIMIARKVCLMKLVAPWCRAIFQKRVDSWIVSRFFRKNKSSHLVAGSQPAMISDSRSSSAFKR